MSTKDQDIASLDERMKAAGMIPLSELLAGGQPLDKWKAHAGVRTPEHFEEWLLGRYTEFMKMRMAYELGDRDRGDDLYEWVFAHASALGEVLVNWRAMKARMAGAAACPPAPPPAARGRRHAPTASAR